MKFNLHGHSSPDLKKTPPSPLPEFVPSPVRSGTPRTHIYIECEAPLQHHKNTDNDNDNNNTYYNFWDVQGGGEEQPQISKSVVLHTKDYGISMGVLSSFFHSPPTSSTRLLFFGSRLLRPRGRPELGAGGATSSSSSLEPAAYSCFIIGRFRSGILSFMTGRLCSCRLICVIGSLTAFTSGPSSICCKKKFKFF